MNCLKKLPPGTEENRYDPVLQWLRLINAETEEDLKMSEKSDIQEIRDAVTVVRTFSADEQMRINAFEREMAMIDHLAEISAAKRDGALEAEKKYKGRLNEAERRVAEETERADQEKNRANQEKFRADAAEKEREEYRKQVEKLKAELAEARAGKDSFTHK